VGNFILLGSNPKLDYGELIGLEDRKYLLAPFPILLIFTYERVGIGFSSVNLGSPYFFWKLTIYPFSIPILKTF